MPPQRTLPNHPKKKAPAVASGASTDGQIVHSGAVNQIMRATAFAAAMAEGNPGEGGGLSRRVAAVARLRRHAVGGVLIAAICRRGRAGGGGRRGRGGPGSGSGGRGG